MTDDLVRVASFSLSTEAHMARAKLESEGIPAAVTNENTAYTYPLYTSTPLGSVDVLVRERDLERATEALREVLQRGQPEALRARAPEAYAAPPCPMCGGTDVRREGLGLVRIIIAVLMLGVPFALFRPRWSCAECGARWKR